MIKIRTVVDFEAAHRQLNDPSKCGRLHGHNWKCEVEIVTDGVNELGYSIDFKDIKCLINQYDHCVILNKKDPLIPALGAWDQRIKTIDGNPTCEVLAKLFLDMIHDTFTDEDPMLYRIRVVLWENERSYAEAEWGSV